VSAASVSDLAVPKHLLQRADNLVHLVGYTRGELNEFTGISVFVGRQPARLDTIAIEFRRTAKMEAGPPLE
jgi:hypothetical protein